MVRLQQAELDDALAQAARAVGPVQHVEQQVEHGGDGAGGHEVVDERPVAGPRLGGDDGAGLAQELEVRVDAAARAHVTQARGHEVGDGGRERLDLHARANTLQCATRAVRMAVFDAHAPGARARTSSTSCIQSKTTADTRSAVLVRGASGSSSAASSLSVR